MTVIHGIRHAVTPYNVDRRYVGGRSNNIEILADSGPKQAEGAGLTLVNSNSRFEFAVSSPAVRTQQTGKIILDTLGLELDLEIYDGIQELSQGVYEGRVRSEVYTDEVLAQIKIEGLDFKLPTGESMRETAERTIQTFFEIAQKYPDQTGLAFGHGLSFLTAAGSILGMTHQEIYQTYIPNVSDTIFVVDGQSILVQQLGEPLIPDYLQVAA